MSSIKSYEERLKEQEESLKEQKEAEKTLENQIFDTNAQTIKDSYGDQIADTEESYEQKFRENRVQKLINERQIAENMANLGLTDSGLNRTQMTANQLSYANNNAEYSRQKQKAVDKLNATMNQLLTENETKRTTALSDIDKTYKDTASKTAMSLYTSDVESETDRIKAEIDAETDRIKAQISANTAAEKERNSALNSLYPKLFDATLTNEEKLAYISAFALSNGVNVGENYDEVERLEQLAGLPSGSVEHYLNGTYSPPPVNKPSPVNKPLKEQTWDVVFDGGKNGGGGINKDAVIKSLETGQQFSLEEFYNELINNQGFTKKEAKTHIKDLQKKLGIK